MPAAKHEIVTIDGPYGPICVNGKIHAAMVAIMKEIDPVGKSATNKHQGYDYRPVDEFMNVANVAMSNHKVTVRPIQVEDKLDDLAQVKNYKGEIKYKHRISVVVTYMFQHEDGSFILAQSRGFGEDSSDKASNKALAASFKYLLMQSLLVPTRELDDGDSETPPPATSTKVVKSEQVDSDLKEYGDWLDQITKDNGVKELNRLVAHVAKNAHKDAKPKLKQMISQKAKSIELVYDTATRLYQPKQ